MQEFQNTLYINPDDPTNAVIYDRAWLREAAHRAGLRKASLRSIMQYRESAFIRRARESSGVPLTSSIVSRDHRSVNGRCVTVAR